MGNPTRDEVKGDTHSAFLDLCIENVAIGISGDLARNED